MRTCALVSRRTYYIENTYRQKTSPHGRLEPSDFSAPSTDTFVKIDHDRPKILDMFQALCDLLQGPHVFWPRENSNKGMPLSNCVKIHAWPEEDLSQLRSSLRRMRKAMEKAVNREPFFA